MKISDIQEVVCKRFDISKAALLGGRQKRHVCNARLVAYWFACELFPEKSMAQIALAFRRERTTIVHGHQRARDLALRDQDLIDRIKLCLDDLWEITRHD